MKTDLASSIGAAVAGILIAYFICNLFIGPIEDVSFTTVDSSIGTDLDEPSPEVFNYRALNPTVEVYVGDDTEEEIQQIQVVEPEEENQASEDTETEIEEDTNGNTN